MSLQQGQVVAASRVVLVDVPRATAIANPAPEVATGANALLTASMLADVSDGLLRSAAKLASSALRTLDAIHLASALRVEADELLADGRRLLLAAAEPGRACSGASIA